MDSVPCLGNYYLINNVLNCFCCFFFSVSQYGHSIEFLHTNSLNVSMTSLRAEGLRIFYLLFCSLWKQSPYYATCMRAAANNHASHHHPTQYKIFPCTGLHICLSELCKYSEKSGEILSDCKEFYILQGFSLGTRFLNFPNNHTKKFLKSLITFFFKVLFLSCFFRSLKINNFAIYAVLTLHTFCCWKTHPLLISLGQQSLSS